MRSLAVFIGIYSSVFQIILLREIISRTFGNEFVIVFFMFFWFLGVSLGGFLGRSFHSARILKYILFMLLFSFVSFCYTNLARYIWGLTAGELPDFYFILSLVAIPTFLSSFWIGVSFVSIASFSGNQGIEKTYFLEALGAFGGYLISVFFIRYFSFSATLFILFVAFSVLSFLFYKRSSFKIVFLFIFGIVILVFGQFLESFNFRYSFLGKKILYMRTPYEDIVVTRFGNSINFYSFGRLLFSSSDFFDGEKELLFLEGASNRSEEKVLVLGYLSYPFLKALLKNEKKVYWFFTDEDFIEILKKYFKEYEKVIYLRKIDELKSFRNERFVLYVNAYPTTIVDNRYFSYEFLKLLNPSFGIFNLPSFYSYAGSETLKLYASMLKTMKRVFNFVYVVSVEGRVIFYGSDIKLEVTPSSFLENLSFKKVKFDYIDPLIVYSLVLVDRIKWLEERMGLYYSKVDINSYLNPVIMKYFTDFFLRFVDVSDVDFLYYFLMGTYIVIFLVFLIFVLWYRKKSYSKYLFSFFLTGALVFVLVIKLSFIYQFVFGSLYEDIAILFSLFMFGLMLGGFFIVNFRSLIKSKTFWLVEFLLTLISYIIVKYGLEYFGRLELFIVTFLIGFLGGIEFPLLGGLWKEKEKELASVLEYSDHFGALFGALGIILFKYKLTELIIVFIISKIFFVMVVVIWNLKLRFLMTKRRL